MQEEEMFPLEKEDAETKQIPKVMNMNKETSLEHIKDIKNEGMAVEFELSSMAKILESEMVIDPSGKAPTDNNLNTQNQITTEPHPNVVDLSFNTNRPQNQTTTENPHQVDLHLGLPADIPSIEANTQRSTPVNRKKKLLIISFVVIVIIVLIASLLAAYSCQIFNYDHCKPKHPIPPKSAYQLQKEKDPVSFAMEKNKTEEDIILMNLPPVLQALNNSAKQIYRWFPLNEISSYFIEVTKQADFNSIHINSTTTNSTNNPNNTNNNDSNIQQSNNKTYYNIQFITIDSQIEYVLFYLLINEGNTTYNLTDILLNNGTNTTNSSNAENSSNIKINSTNQKSDSFQLNLIICNTSRVGKVKLCQKPINIQSSYFMIAMNALDQFLPILNKTYLNIYKTSEFIQGRLLQENKVQSNNQSDTVTGVYGGDYEKNNVLLVSNNSNNTNNTNSTEMQLQTNYKQNSLGGGTNLSAETQELNVKKSSDLNSTTVTPTKSEIQGNLNLTAKKNISVDGVNLAPEDYLCDSLTTNFTVKMTIREDVRVLNDDQVKLLKNLTSLITYEEILNPIENNTIYVNRSQLSAAPSSRILISGNLLFTHHQTIFQKNIIGIDAYGFIEMSCYDSDACKIIAVVSFGIFSVTLYEKEIQIKLTKTVNTYKLIQFKALILIDGITNLINNVSTQLRSLFVTFIGNNKNFINTFIDSIDKAIVKYENIFDEVSNQFSHLGSFIDNTLSIIENEFYNYLQNHHSTLYNNELWLDYMDYNLNSTINELQCQIKSDSNLTNQALNVLSSIYNSFNNFYQNEFLQYNDTYFNGVFTAIQNKVSQIIDANMANISNANVAKLVKDFINKRLQPSFSKWNSVLETEFNDGKVRLNIKYVKASESINITIANYKQFLIDNNQNCNITNIDSYIDINDLLSESQINNIFDPTFFNIENSKMKTEPPNTYDALMNIITDGIYKLMDGIKVIISDSEITFINVFDFTNSTLTNSSKFINLTMNNVFSEFSTLRTNLYQSIKDQINNAKHLYNDVFNSNYNPTPDEIKQIDPDLFDIPQVIDKYFNKFRSMISVFQNTINYFKGFFPKGRLLEMNKRGLSSLTDLIYGPFFTKITSKYSELITAFHNSKASVIDVANSFETQLLLNNYDFSAFENIITNIFSNGKTSFNNELLNNLINIGSNLLSGDITSVLDLKDKLLNILISLLPAKEFPLLDKPLSFKYQPQLRLLSIPILIGTANVDAYFGIEASLQFYWGLSNGEVYVRALASTACYAGITIYAEIIIIRMGIYFQIDFFRGDLSFKIGLNIGFFKFFERIELDVSALGFSVGAFFQIILIKLAWFCFTIDLWLFSFSICLPYLVFDWSDWMIMYQYSFTLFSMKMTLVDKFLT